jgi:hypothetical protein
VKGKMKIFQAMVFKREIGSSCSFDVKMLDTEKDGVVLTFDQSAVNDNDLLYIKDFVNQHNLSLLLDSECYFISTNVLQPSSLSIWEN